MVFYLGSYCLTPKTSVSFASLCRRQSPSKLEDFVLLEAAVDCKTGQRHSRAVIMSYMTMSEFPEVVQVSRHPKVNI